jgi:hypothetical protein
VDRCFKVGAVPKAVKWPAVAASVEAWYLTTFPQLPLGRSHHVVAGLSFDLEVDVEKDEGDGDFFISRWMPPESLDVVVSTALRAKFPKLVAAEIASRILLLEKDSPPRSPDEIRVAIDRLQSAFPTLDKVDEAWVINTVAWPRKDYTPAYFVWPRPQALTCRHLRNLARRRGP